MEERKKRRVQQRTIENREKLIKAAKELFKSKGFYSTNSKEIAQVAGVSTGVFYNYFDDKIDIFLEICRMGCNNSYKALEEIMNKLSSKNEDARELLKSYIKMGLAALHNNAHIFEEMDILKKEYPQIEDIVREHKKQFKEMINSFYPERTISNFELKNLILFNTINGSRNTLLKMDDKNQKEEYIEALSEMLCNFLFNYKKNPLYEKDTEVNCDQVDKS